MFRVVTVAGECGSGAGAIAQKIAEKLGWNLLDRALITTVAQAARVDVETVRRYDEHVDSWWHRFHLGGLRAAIITAGAPPDDARFFDTGTIAKFVDKVIAKAARTGKCVIVGRGSQCILQARADVFHVFVYAPWEERVERAKRRVESPTNLDELIRSIDRERARYIRTCFGCDWKEPHLYHMMISSELGTEVAAGTIIDAVRTSGAVARIRMSIPIPTT